LDSRFLNRVNSLIAQLNCAIGLELNPTSTQTLKLTVVIRFEANGVAVGVASIQVKDTFDKSKAHGRSAFGNYSFFSVFPAGQQKLQRSLCDSYPTELSFPGVVNGLAGISPPHQDSMSRPEAGLLP
jgi:hypothetical protein